MVNTNYKTMAAIAVIASASYLSGINAPQAQEPTTVSICTGSEGGSYHTAGEMFAKTLAKTSKMPVEVKVDTGGSIGNVDLALASGDCNIFIAQPDVMVNLKRSEPIQADRVMTLASLHDEYAILLVNPNNRVDSLGDLEDYGKEASLVVGDVDFSGASATWKNLVANDEDYGAVRIAQEFDDTEFALEDLAQGSIDAILLVTGMNANATLNEANSFYKGKIAIGPMNDRDFDDATDLRGEKLLTSTEVPCNELTKNLDACSWTGGASVDTYKMQAQLFAVKDAFTKKELKQLRRAARRAAQNITNRLN